MTRQRRAITLNAPGKLYALTAIAALCQAYIMTAMFVDNAPDTQPAWTTLGGIVGYLIGNGVGARRGENTEGVWKPVERRKKPRTPKQPP